MALTLSSSTLGSYITAVRDLLNQPNAANSFWSDAELTRYLNEGIRMYFLEVTNNDEGQWTRFANLDIASGVETIDLPTDCYEIKAVYKLINNGYAVLPYKNAISDSYSTQGGSGTETYFPSYYFQENKLVLRPIPNFTQTAGLRIEYIYFPDVLQNPGDTMSGNVLPIFKQLIEMYAVYKAKMKESLVNNTDLSSQAKANLGEIYKLFIDTVINRSKYPQYIKPFNAENTW